MNRLVSEFSVYTVRESKKLDAISERGGSGQFTERKRWVTGLALLEQAKRHGLKMPIIFADAGDTRDGLLYYGFLRELIPDAKTKTTTYSFEGLRRIAPNTPKHSLKLRSTKKPLSDAFIRPYAVVQTPDYIRLA